MAAMLGVLILSLGACGASSPKLERISLQEWEQVRRSYQGQVLVVNVWASWCRACVELFPSIVELQREYEPAGTQFVSLCLDDLAELEDVARIQSFLTSAFGDPHGVSSGHYAFEEDFADIMDRLSLPSLPGVLVYDAAGQLRHKLSGDELNNEVSPADVEDAIESLIAPLGPRSGSSDAVADGRLKGFPEEDVRAPATRSAWKSTSFRKSTRIRWAPARKPAAPPAASLP